MHIVIDGRALVLVELLAARHEQAVHLRVTVVIRGSIRLGGVIDEWNVSKQSGIEVAARQPSMAASKSPLSTRSKKLDPSSERMSTRMPRLAALLLEELRELRRDALPAMTFNSNSELLAVLVRMPSWSLSFQPGLGEQLPRAGRIERGAA